MISISETLAQALSPDLSETGLIALSTAATLSDAPAGHKLFASGDKCENFVLVVEGQVRVQIATRTGREMILYRLKSGESCALTTSCLLTHSPYYAEGIAEVDVKLITIPAPNFRHILKAHNDLSLRIIDNYAQRIGDLTRVIDRLMTRDLQFELKSFLKSQADTDNIVHMSHKKIADELGSSREVISRKLKAFEKSGLVKLSRGQVELIDLN